MNDVTRTSKERVKQLLDEIEDRAMSAVQATLDEAQRIDRKNAEAKTEILSLVCSPDEPCPDERAAFERWCKESGYFTDWTKARCDGELIYLKPLTQRAWHCWQAARASQPPGGALNVAPIARIEIIGGEVSQTEVYAPGLPDGAHELFPVPLNPAGELLDIPDFLRNQQNLATERASQPPSAANAQTEAIVAAALAVVARWDTPSWKDVPATGGYIDALRNALSGRPAPAPGPDLELILQQAHDGLFVEHDCPAMYACAAIIAEFGEERVKAYQAKAAPGAPNEPACSGLGEEGEL